MIRPGFFILALATLLAACGAEEEESVEDRFKRTEAAIINTAESLEAETENAVSATENRLEGQADMLENGANSAEPTEGNLAANETR